MSFDCTPYTSVTFNFKIVLLSSLFIVKTNLECYMLCISYLCCSGLKHLQSEGSYVKYKNSPGASLRCLYSQPHQGVWDQILIQIEQNQSLMLLYGEAVHDNTILLVVELYSDREW